MLNFKLITGSCKATAPFQSTLAIFGDKETAPTVQMEASELLSNMRDNGDEGILLRYNVDAPEELIEALTAIGAEGVQLLITTDDTDNVFYKKIGQYVVDKSGFDVDALTKAMMADSAEDFIIMVGVTTLDQFVPKGYLIRFGAVDETQLHPTTSLGVATMSRNQKVVRVKRGKL